jgi:hypothetical protein
MILGAAVFALSACGGDGKTTIPGGTASASPEPQSPTATETPLYGPRPTLTEFKQALDAALARSDPQAILPQYTAESIENEFKSCAGEIDFGTPEDTAVQTWTGCQGFGQEVRNIYQKSKIPEYLRLMELARDTHMANSKEFAGKGYISPDNGTEQSLRQAIRIWFTP